MKLRVLTALGLLSLLASACGTTSPAGQSASSARSSTAPATAIPTPSAGSNDLGFLRPAEAVTAASAARTNEISCSGAIGATDSVAIVQLHTGGTVMRDYADPAHPRTVCQFPPNLFPIDLVDARHVVVGGEADLFAVIDLTTLRTRWFQLPSDSQAFPSLLGVSPHLDQVAYLVNDISTDTDKVHVASARGDVIVASLRNPHGGRCGSPEDSRMGAYTESARFLYVLDQPFPTINSLAVIEGTQQRLLITPPAAPPQAWPLGTQPAMALWSPATETLYYRQNGDVWKWTSSGGAQKFLPGVSWYYPTISADGAHLAYAALRSDGLHNVYLVDLLHGGSPQVIGKGPRNLPVFLNSSQLWFRSEGQGICGPGGDQPLVYDLGDGSEASSIVDFVGSVWPSTSSNF